ncbi:MAG: High-affinity zinc uptake system binding-protein ZnuA [Chlamydiae bacterium]|nr:High-affinity zinc uptake system binding-protein ZnuA [Chlamydiota bacterium]
MILLKFYNNLVLIGDMGYISTMIKKNLLICLLVLGFIGLGCQRAAPKGVEERPLVVVSVPPYISIVEAIAGDSVRVESATRQGFDPHTMEVTPRQREMVQGADLFIAIGEPYEAKLLAALREEKGEMRVLYLNEKIPTLTYQEDTHSIEACGRDHAHHHGSESRDLHFWLSPRRLPMQAKLIADSLTELNPALRERYSESAKLYIQRVQELDSRVQEMVSSYAGDALLVPHSALGYFCSDYQLVQIAVECEGKSPLPHHIAAILDLAKKSEVRAVFTFPHTNNKSVEVIAKELNLRTTTLDPLAEDPLETIEQIATEISEKWPI